MSAQLRQLIWRGRAFFDRVPWRLRGIAIVVLLSVALVAILMARTDHPGENRLEPLYEQRKLSAVEQQRIEAALATAGLTEYRVRQGVLWVVAAERSKYSAAIATANCLQDFNSPTEEALRSSSLIEVGARRHDRLDHAREQEARLALLAIPGIEDAFVYFDETTPQGLKGERKITASVGVRTAPDEPLDFEAALTVQRVVLRIKAGLLPEGITVTDLRSRRSFLGVDLADEKSPSAQFLIQRGRQQQLEKELRSMLAGIPGARLGVQILPHHDDTSGVRVSVGIPMSYVDQIEANERVRYGPRQPPDRLRLERRVRTSIQTAMLPLLPNQGDTPAAEMITVTLLDDPLTASSEQGGAFEITPRQVLMLGILALVACAVLLLLSGRQRDDPPRLKVHADPEPTTQTNDHGRRERADQLSLHHQLHTYVEEDPEEAARSLSDWIDQAG